MCEKFHYQLRNDRALGNRKYDNNNSKKKHNNKNNVDSAWGPVSGSKNIRNMENSTFAVAIKVRLIM